MTLVLAAVGLVGLVVVLLGLVLGDVVDALDVTGGYLSVAVLGGAASAFGIAGAATSSATGSPAGALLVGVLAGLLMGVFALLVTRAVARTGTDRALTASDLLGRQGVVVSPVRAGTYGEVRVRVGGHPLKLAARADHDLPVGAEVFVVETLSAGAVRIRPL
jgi:membrane protein implicated in regulation of membrane protease activity